MRFGELSLGSEWVVNEGVDAGASSETCCGEGARSLVELACQTERRNALGNGRMYHIGTVEIMIFTSVLHPLPSVHPCMWYPDKTVDTEHFIRLSGPGHL